MIRAASPFSSITDFSPAPSPPPPSPASTQSPLYQVGRKPSTKATFDVYSTSPASWSASDQTYLKAQLDRARRAKVATKPGVPARLLSTKELERLRKAEAESEETSTTDAMRETGNEEGEAGDDSSSPWMTDPESPATSSPAAARPAKKVAPAERSAEQVIVAKSGDSPTSLTSLPIKQSIRIRGFQVIETSPSVASPPADSSRLPPSASTPLSPSTSPTSRLSSLLARPTTQLTQTPAIALPPTTSQSALQPRKRGIAAAWNTNALATALAAPDSLPPHQPPVVVRHPYPSHTGVGSSSMKLSRAGSGSKPASIAPFPMPSATASSLHITTSVSLNSSQTLPFPGPFPHRRLLTPASSRPTTPNPSPPLSPIMSAKDPKQLTLHFARRPGMCRIGSTGDMRRNADPEAQGEPEQQRVETWRGGASPKSPSKGGAMKSVHYATPPSSIGRASSMELTDTEPESECEELSLDRLGASRAFPAVPPQSKRLTKLRLAETSVFASPRSNSATSLSSASSSRFRHASTSPSKPSITSKDLSAAFSAPSPSLASRSPQQPVRRAASDPSTHHVDMKGLRAQQLARRNQMETEGDSEEVEVVGSPPGWTTRLDSARKPKRRVEAEVGLGVKPQRPAAPGGGLRRLFSFS
ncbi:hypothetical protein JCM1840_004047 [Sporobolomyces johnsonii]